MNKILCYAIIFVFLVACGNEPIKKPASLIEREKMVDIMYDLSLLESMKVEPNSTMDSVTYTANQYIYKKYSIDSIQFAHSNIYYAADYKDYEQMYNQIKVRLEKNKKKVEGLIKNRARKELQKAKTRKKLKEKKVKDSINNAKRTLLLKKQADSVNAIKIKNL